MGTSCSTHLQQSQISQSIMRNQKEHQVIDLSRWHGLTTWFIQLFVRTKLRKPNAQNAQIVTNTKAKQSAFDAFMFDVGQGSCFYKPIFIEWSRMHAVGCDTRTLPVPGWLADAPSDVDVGANRAFGVCYYSAIVCLIASPLSWQAIRFWEYDQVRG